MPALPETQQALSDLPANSLLGGGEHMLNDIRTGTEGRYVGSIPYDPRDHFPHDIDPLSPTGIALGEDYVRQVRPTRPLTFSLAIDQTARAENPVLTAAKKSLAESLADSLDLTVSPGDRVFSYVVRSDNKPSDDWRYETVQAEDSEAFTSTLLGLANRGLTIVISDFRRVNFAHPELDLSGIVAVKTNHKLERNLPAGIGVVSLGGYNSVNTNKKRELLRANKLLHNSHEDIVAGLNNAGAGVASVVIDPKHPDGFNLRATDQAIATAIRSVSAV
ncbi:MAG: hypothetical protein V4702_01980 [Patescibacteria group bacterium]